MLKRSIQTHDPNSTIKTGLIFSFFLFASLLVTYPVILKMKTHVHGTPMGDLFSMIWYFWWQKYALFHGMSAQFTPYVAAPFGVNFINWPVYLQPILNYPALILALIFNEIFAYNALVIMSFFISAVTMYYLAYYLTKNRLASMTSGFIFSFSPYHFSHALGHLNIVFGMQCLPLFVLAMLKLD